MMDQEQTAAALADDAAVDAFAAAMKARMAEKRAKGYGGWDDPQECPTSVLLRLAENVPLGKPVDMGNYAMMLFHRYALEAAAPAPAPAPARPRGPQRAEYQSQAAYDKAYDRWSESQR